MRNWSFVFEGKWELKIDRRLSCSVKVISIYHVFAF